jgi:hypothetical protein
MDERSFGKPHAVAVTAIPHQNPDPNSVFKEKFRMSERLELSREVIADLLVANRKERGGEDVMKYTRAFHTPGSTL